MLSETKRLWDLPEIEWNTNACELIKCYENLRWKRNPKSYFGVALEPLAFFAAEVEYGCLRVHSTLRAEEKERKNCVSYLRVALETLALAKSASRAALAAEAFASFMALKLWVNDGTPWRKYCQSPIFRVSWRIPWQWPVRQIKATNFKKRRVKWIVVEDVNKPTPSFEIPPSEFPDPSRLWCPSQGPLPPYRK